jgi:hypothetical protein
LGEQEKEFHKKTPVAPPKGKDPMEGYVPRTQARKGYEGEGDNGERISTNLNRINKRYVATPYRTKTKDRRTEEPTAAATGALRRKAVRIPTTRAENAAISRRRVAGAVKTRLELVTEKNTAKRPFPVSALLCCVALTAMFMYMISLYIQIDDYSANISTLKGELSRVNDEIVSLDLRLQNKYDLDEIEQIAVEEYGMVRADQLPKKYVSLAGDDVVEVETPQTNNGFGNLLSVFASIFGFGE